MAKSSTPKNADPLFFTVFPIAWGPMGAVAGSRGLVRVVLPHYQANDIADLLQWEYPGAVRSAGPFEQFAELCRGYFNRQPTNFAEVQCDLPGENTFAGKVYRACREIPFSQTQSYRELAMAIRRPDAARAVAAAMGKNPLPLVVPCHRVVYADGRCGGFSAAGGVELKQRMLAHEQAD